MARRLPADAIRKTAREIRAEQRQTAEGKQENAEQAAAARAKQALRHAQTNGTITSRVAKSERYALGRTAQLSVYLSRALSQ